MKRIISLVIVLGFVIILSAAGSVEHANMGFVKALLLEIVGMATVLSGISAFMHYRNHERRMIHKRRIAKRTVLSVNHPSGTKIRIAEKELC